LANPAAAAMFRTTQATMCADTMKQYVSLPDAEHYRKNLQKNLRNSLSDFLRKSKFFTEVDTNTPEQVLNGLRADGAAFPLAATMSFMIEQGNDLA
jgi:hypothetical protein